MIEDQIKIEKIRRKDLYAFARNAPSLPQYQAAVPISMRRALSQSNNPYSHPNDMALLVALHDDKCVGYQGILPGLLWHNGELKSVHWSTAFFVSPEYRGAGVAGRLLREIKKLNIDFPVTRMTESARQAYLKAGFKELGNLTYYQLRMEKIRKMNEILQAAKSSPELDIDDAQTKNLTPDFPKIEPALYQHLKVIFYQQVAAGLKPNQAAFEKVRVDQIDLQAQKAVRPRFGIRRFYRGIEAVNWMLKYRWIISARHEKVKAEPYYFSLVNELFDYVALEIYSADKKKFKGFLILSVSAKKGRTWLKILDFAFEDPADDHLAAYFGLIYAKKFSADRLEFPADLLDYFTQNSLLQPLIKAQQRLYLFYPKTRESVLEGCRDAIELDYCDADTAFT